MRPARSASGAMVVRVPPLRERREGIPDLVYAALRATRHPSARVGNRAMAALMAFLWPGTSPSCVPRSPTPPTPRGAPTSRSCTGSGIGLAVVGDLVTAHQGTVEATSGPTGGAMFTIRLPVR